MTLPAHISAAIRRALDENRRWAEAACQAPDTEAARDALLKAGGARIQALQLLNDAEREVREAALAKLENAA